MSNLTNLNLIESAIDEADRLNLKFFYDRLELLVNQGDMEGLFVLVKHMKGLESYDTSDEYCDQD